MDSLVDLHDTGSMFMYQRVDSLGSYVLDRESRASSGEDEIGTFHSVAPLLDFFLNSCIVVGDDVAIRDDPVAVVY